MRIYDEKCADSNGTPISGTWESRQQEIEANSTIKQNSLPPKYHNNLYEYYKDNQFDKIVGY